MMADFQPGECDMADKTAPKQMATMTMQYRDPAHAELMFEWTHLNGRDPATITWLAQQDHVPELVRQALVTMETRPRYEPIEDGVLLNLRAPALVPGDDQDALVSIRMWLTPHRAITVSMRDSEVMAAVIDKFNAGRHRDPGDLVACFATLVSERLDNQIAELGDALDDLELGMESAPLYLHRHKVSEIRSQSIEFRRFVLPQYHALERFSVAGPDWLDDDDVLQLRNAADRFARMGEELEAIRERSALMREELTDRRSELMDTRALLISIVALIFLPLTFLTGLLGMNVDGIPYAHAPWAFWGVVSFCLIVSLAMAYYFKRTRWTRG
ncbi:zinc transporter ZntB [Aquisediminimonas sediminicola]|uniref:zinc transporter ZntB n=1 Tax=Alteraquisediminimonas sediminicola TaxID=2676787 RepID=UPI001FE522AF|nr:zinc transporter ZntB [Aquisediminimonas sediminicola]